MAGSKLAITKQIDADEGLKSKRKLLTVTSLILLALSFSGAKVEEANTFILKLSFGNDKGITILLVLAVVFSLIRYYNYAAPYHRQLYEQWSKRMLSDPFFLHANPYEPDYRGLVIDLQPKGFDIENMNHFSINWSLHYKRRLFIVSEIIFSWSGDYEEYYESVWVGWRHASKVLRLEARYRIEALFKHRENLDIYTPYLLGFLAILSFAFNKHLQMLLNVLAGS
jgi:hypothetical protein